MKMFSGLCMKRAFKVLPIWNLQKKMQLSEHNELSAIRSQINLYEHIDTKFQEKLPMQHKFSQFMMKICSQSIS